MTTSETDPHKRKVHISKMAKKPSKHRSRSAVRNNVDKPKSKRSISAATSFVSIPSAIKLSILNSGLIPSKKFSGKYYF